MSQSGKLVLVVSVPKIQRVEAPSTLFMLCSPPLIGSCPRVGVAAMATSQSAKAAPLTKVVSILAVKPSGIPDRLATLVPFIGKLITAVGQGAGPCQTQTSCQCDPKIL